VEGTNSHDGAGNRETDPHAGLDGCVDHRPGAARDASASSLAAKSGAATRAEEDNPNGHDPNGHDPGRTYAALDLGTNNCRLLVARPSRRGFKVVDAFSRIIRLGEGVSATGRLSEPAIERTIDALRVCAAKMDRNKVERAGLIATGCARTPASTSRSSTARRRRSWPCRAAPR
jgi:exopolyphosphatase/guanosine-5'-triphosphate,3'-diphosphate pyrophosphatase